MNTKKNKDSSTEEQLAFYFWLGEDGELVSVDEEEFAQKQEEWQGERPSGGNN